MAFQGSTPVTQPGSPETPAVTQGSGISGDSDWVAESQHQNMVQSINVSGA